MNKPKFLYIQRSWSPYLVLLSSLIITGISALYVSYRAHIQDQFRFDNQVNIITSTVENRINTYITTLLGGRGLFHAVSNVTREEFHAYAIGLGLQDKYPGIQGFGFIKKIFPDQIEGFNSQLDAEGFTGSGVFPAGERSVYYVIQYVEPVNADNISSLGYDMYSDIVRKTAFNQAERTGNPTMSGKLTLIQDTGDKKQPAFLIIVPIYKSVISPVPENTKELYGFIYSSYRANYLLDSIFNPKKNLEIAFNIYVESVSPENLLYSSTNNTRSNPLYSSTRELTIADKKWIFTFSSLTAFENASENKLLSTILAGGVIISLLLFLINMIQLRAREAAERSAMQIFNSEQALQESNHRISSILNSITDGFIALDHKWKFTYINKAAARTLRKHPEEVLGKSIWDELPGLESTRIGKAFEQSVSQNIPLEIEDYYNPFKAWLSVRLYPSQTGLSIYFADMTERHRLEKQKDDFLGVASHELKTPVTSIKAYVQVLEKRFLHSGNRQAYSLLNKVNMQINKLTGLITDLLDVTKIEAGKLSLKIQQINLNTLVKQTIEEMQITTERHKIYIEGQARKPVYTDPERVSQVLTNLISNAIKYSPRSDKIIVKIKNDKSVVIVSVQDFGVGISEAMKDKVFDRFFRVSEPNRITYPGLGLGLYISSEIVKRLNGKIWLKSTEGKGSTFFFSIPAH